MVKYPCMQLCEYVRQYQVVVCWEFGIYVSLLAWRELICLSFSKQRERNLSRVSQVLPFTCLCRWRTTSRVWPHMHPSLRHQYYTSIQWTTVIQSPPLIANLTADMVWPRSAQEMNNSLYLNLLQAFQITTKSMFPWYKCLYYSVCLDVCVFGYHLHDVCVCVWMVMLHLHKLLLGRSSS